MTTIREFISNFSKEALIIINLYDEDIDSLSIHCASHFLENDGLIYGNGSYLVEHLPDVLLDKTIEPPYVTTMLVRTDVEDSKLMQTLEKDGIRFYNTTKVTLRVIPAIFINGYNDEGSTTNDITKDNIDIENAIFSIVHGC